MSDKILVKDLLLRGIIGINDWERENRQDILINLTLFTDLRPAGVSDRADDILNYRTITKAIIAHVEQSSYFTVEALAAAIARICVVDHKADRARRARGETGRAAFCRVGGCRNRTGENRL